MKVLEIKELTKYYGNAKVLDNVSFSIDEGEIVGLVGPNGAGKTTTIKSITSLIFFNKGQIKICGYDLIKERENSLQLISSIIETPAFYSNLTGMEHLKFIASMRKASKERLNNIISFIELKDSLKNKISKYSLGMKQRLALGMALISSPKLLILDEPTNGLDPSGILDLREFLLRAATEQNLSILISSHNLEELDKLCNRTVFIKKGAIISQTKQEQIKECEEYYFSVDNNDNIKNILSNIPYIIKYNVIANKVYVQIEKNKLAELITILIEENVKYTDLQIAKFNMESKYKELYSEESSNERIS